MPISNSLASWDKRAGFSLVEIIIVTAMILILSMVVFTFGRNIQNILALKQTQGKLIALVGRSRSLAQQFALNPPANKEICAYGVHVDQAANKIFIFQDLVARQDNPSLCDSHTYQYNSDEDGAGITGELNTMDLSSGNVIISNSTTLTDVVFIPPDPTVVINDPFEVASAVVTVKIKDTSSTASVQVNNFGQITVE